ncbi:MAG: hypothetical protein ACI9RY_000530 [Reinekea sp.]|jgi:hypothetical protein
MKNNADWFARAQKLQLPAILPIKALPSADAPLLDWMSLIREDPLLTIHLFRSANKMISGQDMSAKTLDHAVSLLGSTRLVELCAKVPRVDEDSVEVEGLLRAIGDSLVAASLMRQWYEIRQIPWSEGDYWTTLFYDLGLWVLWLLEPEKMANIELSVEQGGNRDALLRELLGMEVRAWNEKLCRHFQLPVVPSKPNDELPSAGEIRTSRQAALKFFLPFSHELAFVVRQDWLSEALDSLCKMGETSLGMPEFRPILKRWVTTAAREITSPHAALAARRLVAQQPGDSSTATTVSTDTDQPIANKPAKPHAAITDTELPKARPVAPTAPVAPVAPVAPTPPTAPMEPVEPTAPVEPRPTPVAKQKPVATTTAADKVSPPALQRKAVDLNMKGQIQRQFGVEKNWHSPSEIHKSAFYGLQRGLGLSRIVVFEIQNDAWQAFGRAGCKENATLGSLTLPIQSSSILLEFSKRITALWVNPSNRPKAAKLLPANLIAAAGDGDFFLRSFAVDQKITMLLYVDGCNQPEPLNAVDYKLFREYCADWNTALTKVKS